MPPPQPEQVEGTPPTMPPLPGRRPGLWYYLGRAIQLLALLGLIIVSFLFPYVQSFLHLLFFTIEGVVLFLVGWLMVRHSLRQAASRPVDASSGERRG